MYINLPHGVKISITRSIIGSFEQYMKNIQWDEKKYSLEKFTEYWNKFALKSASWYQKIDSETLSSPIFHEELAQKMNETILKILTEEPTEDQIEELDDLIRGLGIEDIEYTCKTEAKFHIERLKNRHLH